ncbi:MAG: ribonuclease HII [bacterium]
MAHKGIKTNYERDYWRKGINTIAGLDEVGRGAWAGPMVAAAVVFPRSVKINGINDSKKLTPSARQRRFVDIIRSGASWGIGIVEHTVIDIKGVTYANQQAFKQALANLPINPRRVVIDGPLKLDIKITTESINQADSKIFTVAAASIIAKVYRDYLMTRYHEIWPEYCFDEHKGYGTKAHQSALAHWGYSPIHRRSFC